MRNRSITIYLLYIGLAIILVMAGVGCSEPPPPDTNDSGGDASPATPVNSSGDVSPVASAYPAPTQEGQLTQNTYPGAEVTAVLPEVMATAELPLTLPSPAPGLATLGGVVIDEKTRQAPPESLLFLGEVVYTDKNLPIVSVDKQNDPVIILQPNGAFVFENVTPGEYGIIFFTPDYSFLLEDKETGESIIVTLAEDELLDIGLHELPPR